MKGIDSQANSLSAAEFLKAQESMMAATPSRTSTYVGVVAGSTGAVGRAVVAALLDSKKCNHVI